MTWCSMLYGVGSWVCFVMTFECAVMEMEAVGWNGIGG